MTFLFPNFEKKSLAEQKFESNDEVISAQEACFAGLENAFSCNLKKWEHRRVQGIELKGHFIEK